MDRTELDFQQAREKHILFKTNLRSILYGEIIDAAPVLSQYECGVGKWIYGHALNEYRDIPEMKRLEEVHADIHECARKLIALYKSDQVKEAREGLVEIDAIADSLIRLLSAVEQKIESTGKKETDSEDTDEVNTRYKESQALYKTIKILDQRIQEQTLLSIEARKLAEANEHKFRNTVMQAPVGITILRGRDMIVEMANETYLAIVDKSSQEFTGKPLFDSLPEVRNAVEPILLTILDTGKPFYGNEFPVILNRFGKKEQTYFNFVYHPLREEDNGAIHGIIVVATEVTTQVMTKKALEQKDSQFRNLVAQSPIAMAIFRGPDHIIEIANETLLKNIWRKKLEAVEGKKLLDIFPELTSQVFPALLKKVLDTGTVYKESEALAIVNSEDGSRNFYLDFEYAPLYEPNGTVSGIMVTVHDVTEKVEARKTIEASEEKFRVLANSMAQFIWTAAPDGNLNYFSQSVFEYTGFTEKRIFEEGWLEIVHPEDREKNIELWVNSVTTGKPFHYEHRFLRHDGEYRWQLSRAVPQKNTDGTIRMWVGTSTDIHDQRLFSEELTEKVEERTKDLKAINDKLQRSNNELMQFNYVASHDLQEPLRKIQTFVGRIMDLDGDILSEKSKDFFERVQKSANRTQKLIQDLLSFSRANTTEKHFEETDFNEVIKKVKDDLREKIVQNTVSVTHDKLPILSTISFQMEQLFSNLIINSIKFRRQGIKPEITIYTEIVKGSVVSSLAVDPNKKYYHLCYTDNGIGFEPEYNERIFMVFQRLDAANTEGTGIGLAICKKILENHNGYISAEGRAGAGATFHIYLPVYKG